MVWMWERRHECEDEARSVREGAVMAMMPAPLVAMLLLLSALFIGVGVLLTIGGVWMAVKVAELAGILGGTP